MRRNQGNEGDGRTRERGKANGIGKEKNRNFRESEMRDG